MLQEWFDDTYDASAAARQSRVLDSVLGPVRIVWDHGEPLQLTWPPGAIREASVATAVATVAVTERSVPSGFLQLLGDPEVRTSAKHGHGAFPVRWLPGRPWLAQYLDGPVVLRDGARIVVSVLSDPHRWTNRVLREVFIHGGRQHGFRLCHSAVIVIGDRGLLVTGNSGAGKTDLGLKLARLTGAKVVTIDRGIMQQHGAGVAVGTLPFGLNIHRDTLAGFGCADCSVLERYPPIHDKHYLSVADAEQLCQIVLTPYGNVTAVVRLNRADGATAWRPLDSQGIAHSLRTADSADTDPAYQVDWLGLAHGTQDMDPNYRVQIGWALDYHPGRSLRPEWVREMADALAT